jgi:hypothetical protein
LSSIGGLKRRNKGGLFITRKKHENSRNTFYTTIAGSIFINIDITVIDGKRREFFDDEVPIYFLARATPRCGEGYEYGLFKGAKEDAFKDFLGWEGNHFC